MIPRWTESIQQALLEDVGRGDLTTNAIVPPGQNAQAILIAREDLVVCGLKVMDMVFREMDSRLRMMVEINEGEGAMPGNTICKVRGPARGILTGERVALNYFQRMSAVATLTRRFVEKVEGTGVKIIDTRKTTPGMRLFQKYAVRIGGGFNHRLGLDDGVLIKDNHIALAGGLRQALHDVRMRASHLVRIEVECDTLEQVQEALAEGAEILLLDNMDTETLRKAVAMTQGKALLEASGGITLDNVREVAETGVDMISVGALTHSAGSRDVSLQITFEE